MAVNVLLMLLMPLVFLGIFIYDAYFSYESTFVFFWAPTTLLAAGLNLGVILGSPSSFWMPAVRAAAGLFALVHLVVGIAVYRFVVEHLSYGGTANAQAAAIVSGIMFIVGTLVFLKSRPKGS